MIPVASNNLDAEMNFLRGDSVLEAKFSLPPRNNTDTYYILTDGSGQNFNFFSANVITNSGFDNQSFLLKQFSIITMSNMMFKGTLPMSGSELSILKKTASRLISKSPTSLRIK